MNPLIVLRDSLYFFRRNLLQIAQLCVPLIILENVIRLGLAEQIPERVSSASELIAALLIYPIYTGALIFFLDTKTRGETPSNRYLLALSVRVWPRLVVLSALGYVLSIVTFQLYVLPYICLTALLAYSECLLVLRGQQPLQAMKGSITLGRGHFWRTVACVLCAAGPFWLYKLFSTAPLDPLLNLVTGCTLGFLQLFVTVVFFRLYMLISEKYDRNLPDTLN